MNNPKFPKSFPDTQEELFLKLILSKDDVFVATWEEWKKNIIFDEINYSVLRLMPLLYLRLKNFKIEDKLISRIKGMYRMAWYKNQLIINSASEVLLLLNRENIPVILLKGLPLIKNVYKDENSRFLGDADFLIEEKHVKKVISMMMSNGWKLTDNTSFYANRLEDYETNKTVKEVTFVNDKGAEIDIHWNIFLFKFIDNIDHPMSYEEVSKYSSVFKINDAHYLMPCLEDMIIHIIVHGSEGNIQRSFRWVVDIFMIINNFNINWDFLLKRINQFDNVFEVKIAFIYMNNNFPISIPKSFMDKLFSIEVDKNKIKEYYKRTSLTRSFLTGTLPYLLYNYRFHHKKGNIITSWYYFVEYLCENFGIRKKRHIPLFIFGKYKKRIKSFIHK